MNYRLEVSQVQDFRCDAKKHALEEHPKEACGVVVNGKYFRCRNVADKPENDFILETRDYIKARQNGKIEAIIHSHPKGGKESPADQKACSRTKINWHIYLTPKDEWLTINP